MLTRLTERRLAKPWGRRDLPPVYGGSAGEAIGEIWFERDGSGENDPLLVKYLFTSERLSIQVHPDDVAARKAGDRRGKDEAWVVLDAVSGGEIGIGLKKPLSAAELRSAAQSGYLADLVDWQRVSAGDAFYSPAGTIHAIGAGVTLIEVQQNADVTYRLHDFGRGRALHLDEAIAVAKPEARASRSRSRSIGPGRSIVVQGPKFTIEKWAPGARGRLPGSRQQPVWIIPCGGEVFADACRLEPPGVWLLDSSAVVDVRTNGSVLLAYEGTDPLNLT